MSRRYDMFGFESLSLEEARPIVEAAIGHVLDERDSSYYGGTYYGYRLGSGRGVRLYRNRDSQTGALVRSEYAHHALLLEISDLPEMDAIVARLAASPSPPQQLRSVTQADDEDADNE